MGVQHLWLVQHALAVFLGLHGRAVSHPHSPDSNWAIHGLHNADDADIARTGVC